MQIEAKSIGKTMLKVTGAACVATGLVVASAIIASGKAAGSVAGGFVAAKKAVEDMFNKKENEESAEA